MRVLSLLLLGAVGCATVVSGEVSGDVTTDTTTLTRETKLLEASSLAEVVSDSAQAVGAVDVEKREGLEAINAYYNAAGDSVSAPAQGGAHFEDRIDEYLRKNNLGE